VLPDRYNLAPRQRSPKRMPRVVRHGVVPAVAE
jgi:hypothetical protein